MGDDDDDDESDEDGDGDGEDVDVATEAGGFGVVEVGFEGAAFGGAVGFAGRVSRQRAILPGDRSGQAEEGPSWLAGSWRPFYLIRLAAGAEQAARCEREAASGEEEVGGAPGAGFRVVAAVGGVGGEVEGVGLVGGVRWRGEAHGGAADGVEAAAEAGVLEGELLVLALELEETILSGEDHVADVEDVAGFEGAIDLHEFFGEGGDVHGASSSWSACTDWS